MSSGQSPGGIHGAEAPEPLKSAMYGAQQGPKDHTRGSNYLRTSSRTE